MVVTVSDKYKLENVNIKKIEEDLRVMGNELKPVMDQIERGIQSSERESGFGAATKDVLESCELISTMISGTEKLLKLENVAISKSEFNTKVATYIEKICSFVDDQEFFRVLRSYINNYLVSSLDNIKERSKTISDVNVRLSGDIAVNVQINSGPKTGYEYEIDLDRASFKGSHGDYMHCFEDIEKMVSLALEDKMEICHNYKRQLVQLIQKKVGNAEDIMNLSVNEFKDLHYTVNEYWFENMANKSDLSYYLFYQTEFYKRFEDKFIDKLDNLNKKVDTGLGAMSRDFEIEELDLYSSEVKSILNGKISSSLGESSPILSIQSILKIAPDETLAILDDCFNSMALEDSLEYKRLINAGFKNNDLKGYSLKSKEYRKLKKAIEILGVNRVEKRLNDEFRSIEKKLSVGSRQLELRDILKVSSFRTA
jgi:hypothetical protein